MAFADTQKLTVQLDLAGNFQAKLSSAARALQGLDRQTSNTQQSLSKFGRNIERGVVIGATAIAGGIGLVVKAASDYESAFAGVRKTVSATEPELKALSDGFREMSKTIPISASELARLGEAGGALGVPTKQLKEFVRVTALLGVTTNLTADEAANSLGVLGNVLHLTGAEYSKFASSLVALGNAGASTERDIVAIAERAGAAGHLIGISTEQILGFASATASLGIEAEAGGTALQKFFIDSAKQVAAGGAHLKEFAKIAGVTTKDFAASFRKDAGGALQEFLKGLGKLPQAKQLKVLEDLGFNDARITRTLLGLANNTKLVGDQMNVANMAFAQNTALTKEAEQRFNTFDSQLQITKNTLTDMAITIGSKLLPKITPLLKRLNEFVGKNQAGIEKFGDNLASGFEKVATALQSVDWTPFIEGLKLSGQIAGTVISAFRSLPEDLQKLVVAGFALNKVTGGLGTSLIKDIGGAIIGNFAQRGSTPANPLFVVDISGGLAGAGLAGAAEAGGAGLLATALPWAVIGASIAAPILVGIKESNDNSALAAGIGESVKQEIAGGATLADLQKSLAATETGISDLSNMWGAGLVMGDALDKLEDQKALLQNQIDLMSDTHSETVRIANAAEQNSADTRSEAAAIRAASADQISATKSLADTLGGAIEGLRRARTGDDIRAAITKGLAQISKGRGSLDNTQRLIAALKGQLKKVDDPKLRADLKAAISRVEKRLPAREFAQKELTAANKILHSHEAANRKIADLKAIEKALKDRGLPHAASVIRQKIEEAKKAQVAATHADTQAIKDKDLSVVVNTTVNTAVSIRDIIKRQTQSSKYATQIR